MCFFSNCLCHMGIFLLLDASHFGLSFAKAVCVLIGRMAIIG